jgi:hypothetical protein
LLVGPNILLSNLFPDTPQTYIFEIDGKVVLTTMLLRPAWPLRQNYIHSITQYSIGMFGQLYALASSPLGKEPLG